jgi:hypothetical protein
MPSCICSVCKHLNTVSCTQCTCCSYQKVVCMQNENGPKAPVPFTTASQSKFGGLPQRLRPDWS